jgi:hypothetical protein
LRGTGGGMVRKFSQSRCGRETYVTG